MKITDVRMEVYSWPREKPITNGLYTYTHSGIRPVIIETDEGITGIGLAGGDQVSPALRRLPIQIPAPADPAGTSRGKSKT